MSYRREKISIKKESEHRLIRLANRNSNRAKRDLAKYKQTGNIADKRAYEMHRKRSYRYRKEIAKRIDQKQAVTLKQLPSLRRQFPTPRRTRRRREKPPETVFQRTVKYREDERTKKRLMRVGFADRESVEAYTDLVLKGQIPIPIDIPEHELFIFDVDEENYRLRRLIALFGGS